jgi:hypothetical protein
MTITVNTKVYSLDTNLTPDSIRYVCPLNDFDTKEILDLKRTAAKPTVDFPGVARSSAKFSRTVVIGGVSYTNIGEANFSIVVGTAAADIDSLRDDLGDLLISSNGDDLVEKHKISQ